MLQTRVTDLRGPVWARRQHHILPYRIYRRQFAHEPLLLAHYTRWRYYTSTKALLSWTPYVKAELQLRSWPDEVKRGWLAGSTAFYHIVSIVVNLRMSRFYWLIILGGYTIQAH